MAGNVIEKFTSYGIETAAIVPHETIQKAKFKDMAIETNKGNHFGLSENKGEAENRLLRYNERRDITGYKRQQLAEKKK